ncbi:MAG: hypothetical protein JWP81_4277 [Ferruginibacter sp.]|nr:hypothetical protein [Ferruginibacter sp.]
MIQWLQHRLYEKIAHTGFHVNLVSAARLNVAAKSILHFLSGLFAIQKTAIIQLKTGWHFDANLFEKLVVENTLEKP